MGKRLRWALALGLCLASGLATLAPAAELAAPRYQGGIRHQTMAFYGSKPCRITASTTAVLCASGQGILDGVCPSGGTLGKYSLALDSDIAGTRSATNSDSYVISPPVYTYTGSTSIPAGGACFVPPSGAGRFTNGLVGVQNDAGHTTILYWHKADGSNP